MVHFEASFVNTMIFSECRRKFRMQMEISNNIENQLQEKFPSGLTFSFLTKFPNEHKGTRVSILRHSYWNRNSIDLNTKFLFRIRRILISTKRMFIFGTRVKNFMELGI